MLVPDSYLSEHQTERLHMRPLTAEHMPLWIAFLQNEAATRYFPDDRKKDPASVAEKWLEWQHTRYASGRFGLLALHLEDGTFVGQCGLLKQEVDGETVLEIGYHLLPECWGKGYATEAAAYFRDYAQQQAIAPFVVSIIHAGNAPSQAVARRNGLVPWKRIDWHGLPTVIYRYNFQVATDFTDLHG